MKPCTMRTNGLPFATLQQRPWRNSEDRLSPDFALCAGNLYVQSFNRSQIVQPTSWIRLGPCLRPSYRPSFNFSPSLKSVTSTSS